MDIAFSVIAANGSDSEGIGISEQTGNSIAIRSAVASKMRRTFAATPAPSTANARSRCSGSIETELRRFASRSAIARTRRLRSVIRSVSTATPLGLTSVEFHCTSCKARKFLGNAQNAAPRDPWRMMACFGPGEGRPPGWRAVSCAQPRASARRLVGHDRRNTIEADVLGYDGNAARVGMQFALESRPGVLIRSVERNADLNT